MIPEGIVTMDDILSREDDPSAIGELIEQLRAKHEAEPKSKSSWTVLLVTLVMFYFAGIISSDPVDIMILMAVVLFHEIGHFITMKILKYDDVKMFFIPFFGAAVSGKPKKESAFKSCLVVSKSTDR